MHVRLATTCEKETKLLGSHQDFHLASPGGPLPGQTQVSN